MQVVLIPYTQYIGEDDINRKKKERTAVITPSSPFGVHLKKKKKLGDSQNMETHAHTIERRKEEDSFRVGVKDKGGGGNRF